MVQICMRINCFSKDYIKYAPQDSYETFSLIRGIDPSWDLWERMAIKDGVNLIDHGSYLEAIAYYGSSIEHIYLYPISQEKADELGDIIDNADFEESEVIENEIAQYTWNGASIEDVLLSWSNK